jgi:hypothetical protein
MHEIELHIFILLKHDFKRHHFVIIMIILCNTYQDSINVLHYVFFGGVCSIKRRWIARSRIAKGSIARRWIARKGGSRIRT